MKTNIASMAHQLALSNTKTYYKDLVEEALNRGLSYEGFLTLVLEKEIQKREEVSIKKKIKGAKFPYIRTFSEMDYNAFSLPVANSIRELQSLAFIYEGRNLILIGNSGGR